MRRDRDDDTHCSFSRICDDRYIPLNITLEVTALSNPSISSRQTRPFLAMTATFQPDGRLDQPAAEPARIGRGHLWDLLPNLHCSVVGTCLTTGDLRKFFGKLNDRDARTASDHTLHGRAVTAAGQTDIAGKLLNKMLDKRHETQIKRFAKAKTAPEVRQLWLEALDRGDIPGAYWATLTHPATNQELVTEAFGEVHMLSHLVGMSNRADIARLRHLQQELNDRDEKISDQEERLHRAVQERADLLQRTGELETELRIKSAICHSGADAPATEDAALRQQLADERAWSARLTARVSEQERALQAYQKKVAALEAQLSTLQAELASVETTLDLLTSRPETAAAMADLANLTLLYVGGRPKLVEQLKALTARRGGDLLSHDGGVEEKASLLPGLISRSDIAFFPVDCVSHHAAEQVKRFCREAGKPFVPLRSASLASFVAATATLGEII
jgi:hypothetical protein